MGLALIQSPSVCAVGFYFDKRRPLALALTLTGGALGPLVFPPLLHWWMDAYTWRGVFILLATFMMQCCVFGALLLPVKYIIKKPLCSRKREYAKQNFTWRKILNFDILYDPTFCIQIINNLLWCIAISPLWILLPDYVIETNMSKARAGMLISITGFGNLFGRALAALLLHLLPNIDCLHFHNIT